MAIKRTVRKQPRRESRRKVRRKVAADTGPRHLTTPHLCLLRAPKVAPPGRPMTSPISIATYNVHRWTGLNGRTRPDPARAGFVISELDADVIALQEVLRPISGDCPLAPSPARAGFRRGVFGQPR